MAQVDLGIGSIGGKDSMSGSFEDLDVPPTLVSFATGLGKVASVTSPEFKKANHRVIVVVPNYKDDGITPEPDSLLATYSLVESLIRDGSALAVSTPGYGCMEKVTGVFSSSCRMPRCVPRRLCGRPQRRPRPLPGRRACRRHQE